MSVAAIAVLQYGALAWCYVLLRKEGASSSSLIAVALIFNFEQPFFLSYLVGSENNMDSQWQSCRVAASI
jgi:hypothetical protein